MLRIFHLLVSSQLLLVDSNQISTTDPSISKIISSDDSLSENNFFKLKRNLNSNSEEKCSLKYCSLCSESLQECEMCEKGYKLSEKNCVTDDKGSTKPISLVSLIVITISLSLFSFFFCGLCIYLARKYRYKYSDTPEIDGDYTKSEDSINIRTIPEEPRSVGGIHGYLFDNNRLVGSDSLIRQLENAFKSLKSLTGDEQISENCSICFLAMKLRKLKKLKCEHLFHYRCIKEWIFAECSACPVCSESIQ